MPASNNASVDQSKAVTFIISHTVKRGHEGRYEDWLKDILQEVSRYPGYLGREILRPVRDSRKYTVILRFDTYEHLSAWAESDARSSYVARVRDLLEQGDVHEIRTGIDYWFTPEGVRPPKPWKQFLLSTSAIYPLSLMVPRLLRPLFGVEPFGHPLIAGLLVAGILSALMTFVIMPRYTRMLKSWLYNENESGN